MKLWVDRKEFEELRKFNISQQEVIERLRKHCNELDRIIRHSLLGHASFYLKRILVHPLFGGNQYTLYLYVDGREYVIPLEELDGCDTLVESKTTQIPFKDSTFDVCYIGNLVKFTVNDGESIHTFIINCQKPKPTYVYYEGDVQC